jgi:hypothetical protein
MLNYVRLRHVFDQLTLGWMPDAEPQNGGLPAYANYRASQRGGCPSCNGSGVVRDPRTGDEITCPDCKGAK